MKLWKAIVIAALAIAVACVAYGTVVVRRGFSATAQPSGIERFMATTARRLAVRSSYRNLKNPLPATPENIRAGMEHFADHCAICHGNDGSGDTMFGKGLYPKPPDMRGPDTQNKSDGELYYTIENGIRLSGMPAFGGEDAGVNDADTWKLVLFIRHLPEMTPEETEQMKQLNPKTDEERDEEKQEQEFLEGGSSQTPREKPHQNKKESQ